MNRMSGASHILEGRRLCYFKHVTSGETGAYTRIDDRLTKLTSTGTHSACVQTNSTKNKTTSGWNIHPSNALHDNCCVQRNSQSKTSATCTQQVLLVHKKCHLYTTSITCTQEVSLVHNKCHLYKKCHEQGCVPT